MTIPVNSIVNVSISEAPLFPSRAGFGTANIVGITDLISPEERLRYYTSIDDIVLDFGADAEETIAAQSYFSQVPRPTRLGITRRVPTAYSARLTSGVNMSVTRGDFFSIVDGSFQITIDSVQASVNGMDFSAISASESQWPVDVALVIQTELKSADASFTAHTCEWDVGYQVWRISSSTTGVSSTIALMIDAGTGTPIKDYLDMGNADTTAVLQGAAAETPLQAAQAARAVSADWYGLLFTRETRDNLSDLQDVAAWIESLTLVFATVTHSPASYDSGSSADLMATFSTAGYRRTNVIYHSSAYAEEYPDASMFGRAFTVDFGGYNTAITLMFKNLPGVSTNPISSAQLDVIHTKNGNAFISVAGNRMYSDGSTSSGTYFDEVHGIDWLTDAVQNNAFGVLYTALTRIPFTSVGGARIQQAVEAALQEAVNNGLAAPGYTQDGRFLSRGYETYVTPIEDVPGADRANRIGPRTTFTILGAGAIHGLQINGSFIR
jgi:hypothetical protein